MPTPIELREPREPKRPVTLNLRTSVVALADRLAERTNRSRSDVVDRVLQDALEKLAA